MKYSPLPHLPRAYTHTHTHTHNIQRGKNLYILEYLYIHTHKLLYTHKSITAGYLKFQVSFDFKNTRQDDIENGMSVFFKGNQKSGVTFKFDYTA